MEIKQLKALQAIVDTGSFSEAAAQLDLTQSALSHQVRRLEEELDETLLIRARPKVYPSEAGQAVLASARRIQAELAALETRFARTRKGPVTGTLRIAATSLSIVYVLGDLCEAFLEKYPGIEVIFTAAETANAAVRRVLSGTSDLAFAPIIEANRQLVTVALGRTEHAFIVRNSHPLAQQDAVSLDELRVFPFVLFQSGSGTRDIMDTLLLPGGGYGRILTESNDAQFIKRIVSITNGVALMPVYALSDSVAREKLSLLPCSEAVPHVDIGIVHRRSVQMHTIELFKQLCLDQRGPSMLHFTRANLGRTGLGGA
ncbi:LysR family transcriptional regulator [Kerstersia sp.]|uniref:LysR family transcriptional regulator n=1 Tax=Kerstersia sp. TaxID=1930783 RepID=UPI003F919D35